MITPIPKKPGADSSNFDNFLPISNLTFLPKILERIVAAQVQEHLSDNSLYELFQSGFHSQHSVENELVKISNDLMAAANSGLLSILLLYLSAGFDTISHSILLDSLESVEIMGIHWFRSYLTGHTQFVQLKQFTSKP